MSEHQTVNPDPNSSLRRGEVRRGALCGNSATLNAPSLTLPLQGREIRYDELWEKEADRLEAHGLYRREDEHDACGVGLIAELNGAPSRRVVEAGIMALQSVWHRGALNADGKTGDGAGVHLQLPRAFFLDWLARFGDAPAQETKLAVGMIFLPRRDFAAQEEARIIIETETIQHGYSIFGWRQVPINAEVIGDVARESCPEITQILIRGNAQESEAAFEQKLYVIRRRIEKKLREKAIPQVYICSLSCRYIIYKGLFLAEQLTEFYPDITSPHFISNYIIFHQRFSTNTSPSWHLAQPFRAVAHNGEINTLRGNLNWMSSFEASFGAFELSPYLEDLIPVISPGLSDTGALDAVFELLVRAGRPAPLAKLMMIPPPWRKDAEMPAQQKAMYEYFTCLVSPWDGPAALVGTDGRYVFAGMDRNGLRPLRYTVTTDGLLILGSEVGMVPVEDARVAEYGRLGPGQMIAVDLEAGKFYKDTEIKNLLANAKPYEEWVQPITRLKSLKVGAYPVKKLPHAQELLRRQAAAGFTREEIETILLPMAGEGKEPVGSMGDDTPLAILSQHYRGLHHFFRQHFSQVTNPPIDPIRESRVMSLLTRLGPVEHILGEHCDLRHILELDSPFLLTHEYEALVAARGSKIAVIDALFEDDGSPDALRRGLDAMLREADKALKSGKHIITLTDEKSGVGKAAIPMILAAAALHTHMVRQSYRKKMSIIACSAVTLDVHSAAVLIGVGATAVNPYLAEATILDRHARGQFGALTLEQVLANYRQALRDGLLKIMSKMGISVVVSYRGGRNFDAIGLARSLITEFFPGLISRISGIGLKGLEKRVLALHRHAWNAGEALPLPIGGFYKYRSEGETHAYQAEPIHVLQTACGNGSYRTYKRYAEMIYREPPVNLRDLLEFRSDRASIPLEQVESVTAIRKRFVAPAMSLGALSPEAHEILAIAMNRIGAASNSGEGGEGRERYQPYANGDNANSTIKQVASARFGVTMEYLNACSELQIKVAQGAKPGEGGQLPGFKVTETIARLRHATPGVSLISPPPHHDIYSIEDLAQLIYDLKQANPEAIVSVKLVAQSGIGTIASGVAKAMADKIVIAGHVGGTGASPYSSIKHAGAPWEMGLAEAHQVLTLNGLRHRVILQTDGGLKTGRDIVIAAMLGAEEYAIGTLSLVAMGCLLVRQCHSNTCPVGICTQDEKLRQKFSGTVEKVIALMSFLAEEVREILASLGYRSLDELIGRSHLLQQEHMGSDDLDALDLGPLLTQSSPLRGEANLPRSAKRRNEVAPSLDETILQDAEEMLAHGEKIQLSYNVRNTHRTIGTRLSSHLCRLGKIAQLRPDHITLRLRGSAGQSLGAFAVKGLRMELVGTANDYVGKGLSGATIIVTPAPNSRRVSAEHTIIGNTVLYGATSGTLYAAGQAGERFAVRNSGARVVVEGCGANGCEYMTAGEAVILGQIGPNFAAGMTGGMAYLYDPTSASASRINPDSVEVSALRSPEWEAHLRSILEEYAAETRSLTAQNILTQWEVAKSHFLQVTPKEILARWQENPEEQPFRKQA
jgi:glutamate synthase (NADPH/NADH) large chain